MTDRLEKMDIVHLVSERLNWDAQTVTKIVDAFLDEVYEALKRGECVSLRGFGSFYIRPEPENWVFKFNPSQRLRRALGWSSTYQGPV